MTRDDLAEYRTEIEPALRSRFAGIFGEPGVNVLDVNLALDRMGTSAAR